MTKIIWIIFAASLTYGFAALFGIGSFSFLGWILIIALNQTLDEKSS